MLQIHTCIQPAALFPDSVKEYLQERLITRGEVKTVGFGNDGQPLLIWFFYMKKVHHQKQPPEVFCIKRCSQKFCKIHRKTPVPEFKKQRLWHKCFLVNCAKFLRTLFLQNTCGRLLLDHFLLTVHCTLRCRREFLKCFNCNLEKFLVVKVLQIYAKYVKIKESTLTN